MKTSELILKVQDFIANKMLIPDLSSTDRWAIRIALKTIVPHKINSFITQNKKMLEELGIYSLKNDNIDISKLKTLLDETMAQESNFQFEFGGITYVFEQSDLDELFIGVG